MVPPAATVGLDHAKLTVMADYDHVVARAVAMRLVDPADARWSTALRELLPEPGAVAAFVAWAQRHPKWQFNVAEVAEGVCAKPVEAAVAILCDIATECLED